jgi:FkbM family methyltransferase
MKALGRLWHQFNHVVLIFRKRGPLAKTRILGTYLRLLLKNLVLVETLGLKLKRENLFGFKVDFFDYSLFIYLFEEIFIKNEYFFSSESGQPVILDCGSNIGMSVLYFKILFPGSRVTAFEPDAQTFKVLELNVRQNGLEGVTVRHNALSDSKKDLKFYYDPEGPGALTMSVKKERRGKSAQTVQGVPLSDFIRGNIDFVKMDIEGAEGTVLRELDASRRFGRVNQMVMEYHHHLDPKKDELAGLLALFEKNRMGYQITSILKPPVARETFQDLLISAYKKG